MVSHLQGKVVLRFSLFLLSLLVSSIAVADTYPPLWNNGTGAAIHYQPVVWPSEPSNPADCGANCGEWKPYTRFQNNIADPRTKDPSNGGTSPQSYVNVASSCIDKSLPSIYYSLRQGATPADDVLMFRWRVESSAHTYATGKNAGSAGATSPWSSALWTVFFDLGGSGYRSLAAHLNGSIGSPSEQIDLISGIWGDSASHSLDYENDPNIHLLGHNPTAFIGSNSKILNFADNLNPTENWPKGAAETSWDYGTTRAKLVSQNSCNEYFIDYQIPVKMLDASAKVDSAGNPGPSITRDTPISMMFCSANSLNNPLQKDCAVGKEWLADPSVAAPFGDYLSFNQTEPYSQPIISNVDVVAPNTCPGSYTLNATVQDTLALQSGVVIPSIKSVDFYYWYDVNGDGEATAADANSEWIKVSTPGTLDSGTLNSWSAPWDSTSLPKGKFLIGVQALDDNTKIDDDMVASGIDNRTVSYLSGDSANEIYIAGSWITGQQALFPQHSPALAPNVNENWYGNPAVTGQQIAILGTAINACGLAPTISLTANETNVAAGETVGYSITVTNPANNTSAITVNSISDVLPNGFSYQSSTTSGQVITDPSESGQILTWILASPVSLSADDTFTLNFDATATTTSGTYNNNASADTSFGDLDSDPVAISVDSARLSLSITPDSYSVAADGSDEITFTIHYANDSVVPVTNVSITSPITSELNCVSCNGGSTGSLSTNTITWTLGDIAGGISGGVSYTITVANSWASSSLTGSATLSATAPDSSAVSVNASSTVAVTGVSISSAASMTLDLTADVIQVSAGGTIVYTLTYKNDGESTANNVILNNTIADGLSYLSCTGGCSQTNGVATWNIDSVAAGASASVTLTVNVTDPFIAQNPAIDNATIDWTDGTQISATAIVGITGQSCKAYYFNKTTEVLGAKTYYTVQESPAITNSDVGTIAKILTVANTEVEIVRFIGPVSSTEIHFDADLASKAYIDKSTGVAITVTGAVYQADSNGNFTAGDLLGQGQQSYASNYKGVINIIANTTGQTLTKGKRLVWVFSALSSNNNKSLGLVWGGSHTEWNYMDGDSSASFCITPPANLTIATLVNDTNINAGDTSLLTYSTTYANTGSVVAITPSLTQNLPAGFINCQYSTNNSNWFNCSDGLSHTFSITDIPDIAAGDSGIVYLRGNAPAGSSSGDTLTSTATISSVQTSEVSDTAITEIASVGVGGGAVAELSLNLSADKTSAVPGDNIVYTLTVTNIGGADATNVAIANTLPVTNYFQYGSCDSCTPTGNVLNWTVGNLAAGGSQSYTYTMATNTTSLPAGITVINDDATATGNALSAVTSNTVTIALTGNPLLALSVNVSSNNGLSPNDEITYNITITNQGSATATSVTVVTPIPAYMHYVGTINASVGSGVFDTINNQVVFSLGDMASSASATLSFKAKVSNNLASGNTTTTFISTASAANSLQKTASASLSADAAPVLTLLKTQSGTMAYPGATLTADVAASTTVYVDSTDQFSLNQLISIGGTAVIINSISSNSLTLDQVVTASSGSDVIGSIRLSMTYRNTGNATATNVSLTEVLAAELTYYSASPSADSAPVVGNSGHIVWNIGSLAAGEFASKAVTIFPDGTQGSFTSTATVDADNATFVNASVITPIGGLSVAKSTSTRYVAPGGVATYKITLKNTLSTDINNISVTELLVSGFTYQTNSATVDGITTEPTFAVADSANLQPIWSNLTVLANSSIIIELSVDISADIGAATYQNELDITVPVNTGLEPFNPLTTTVEDVTVLGDNSGVISGYVFNRVDATGNLYIAGDDIPLANVQVNIHQSGNDCSDLYSSGCYIAYTNNDGYFETVVQTGDWYLDVQSGSGQLNSTWSQTVGTNDNLISVLTHSVTVDDNGFKLVSSHIVSTSAGAGGAIGPTSQTVVEGDTTSFIITPNVGYRIGNVGYPIESGSVCLGTLTGTTFTTENITAACTVTASFILNDTPAPPGEDNGDSTLPIAVNDEFSFSSFDTVSLDVLNNDYDPEGGVVELVAVQSDFGSVVISDGNILFTPESGVTGTFTFTYIIKDIAKNTSIATVTIIIYSEVAPTITVPQDLCGDFTVNADALYTRVDLGEASAVDRFGNVLPVSLINGQPLYPPGRNEAFWQATDIDGNRVIARQLVCVMPLVSIEKDQTVLEGESASISIYLNGKSPVYPLTVPYEVIGHELDHTLRSGEVVIETGTEISLSFDIVADDFVDEDETVKVVLGDTLNLGAKNSHLMLITQGNIAPQAQLEVTQLEEKRITVSKVDGMVTVSAEVYDANEQDELSFQWQVANNALINVATNDSEFIFSPNELSMGVYTITLTVTDNGSPQLKDIASIYIEVVSELVELTDIDSDGDLIPDNVEGYADKDVDGIPDYLDRIDECNVLQEAALINNGYLIEGQSGVCLRRGDLTFGGQTGGAQITKVDIDEVIDDELIPDPDAVNVGGIFDYIAYGLPDLGQSFAIVMPQRKPIPANAVYRKYRKDSGWGFFEPDVNNSLWSTQGEPGYCPPPSTRADGVVWTLGLTEGHWCVQQIIEDGGVNDDDDEVNGTIVDPGGVGVMLTANHLPVAVDDVIEMDVNAEQSIDVLINDTDEDRDVLVITSATTNIGSVSIVDGQLYYVSANNYDGDITINYGISDNNGGTDHAVVTINMIWNKPPVVSDENSLISQGGSVSLNLLANDTDPEDDVLSLINVDNANVSFSGDGQATFTPAADFYGEAVIIYTVQDSAGNTMVGQWVIGVTEMIEITATTTKGGGALFWSLLLLMGCLVTRRRSQG